MASYLVKHRGTLPLSLHVVLVVQVNRKAGAGGCNIYNFVCLF
jgi:hypothetical protein